MIFSDTHFMNSERVQRCPELSITKGIQIARHLAHGKYVASEPLSRQAQYGYRVNQLTKNRERSQHKVCRLHINNPFTESSLRSARELFR